MALRARTAALSLVLVATAALQAADVPPSNLHFVGDHWTAWNPPTSLPPDAKVHVVVPGDTLWDLSRQYLGNPYLWPQIWERNQYVLDAHWIYPGDPLVVGINVAAADAVGAMETEEVAPAPSAETAAEPEAATSRLDAAATRRNTPVPLGSESDIYCTGYIGELEETFPTTVIGSEYETLVPRLDSLQIWSQAKGSNFGGAANTLKYELSVGDILYLDGGRAAGLSPGQVYMAVEPKYPVRHPATRDVIGRFYAYQGRVRVLTVQEDRAIAEIVQSCAGIHVGATLRPFEPEPVPLARRPTPRPFNDPTTADLSAAPAIVLADSTLFTLGQDHVVFIDRGEGDDVYPGDMFTIYRESGRGLPPVAVGELAVLSVRERSAVAKILESRFPVHLGDRLERR
jgi:nucleoid-associated protein YgaU